VELLRLRRIPLVKCSFPERVQPGEPQAIETRPPEAATEPAGNPGTGKAMTPPAARTSCPGECLSPVVQRSHKNCAAPLTFS